MATKLTVLVAGATGQQGGAVARALLDRGHKVRALTRSGESPAARALAELGAEIREGDLGNPESLEKALPGVDAVFGVSTPFEAGTDGETGQGINLVEAAVEAGVAHFVFSSVGSADRSTGIPHFDSKYEVEQALRASGMPFTIIGPVFFMENWTSPWFLPAIQEGNVAVAMPRDCKLAQIAVQDIGNFVALVFERRDEFLGRRIDIASDYKTADEVAGGIGRAAGRELGVFEIPLEGMREQNADFATMFEWFDEVGYEVDAEALEWQYPEVNWTRFDDWVARQDWRGLLSSSRAS